MKRRFAVMAAALTMIILTGCGKGELQTGKESMEENLKKETVESAGEVQNMPTDEIDIWEPSEETITIHTVTTEGDPSAYPEGDDVTDNVWIREYKDRFNIEVVTDWVSNEYDTKLNLSIAEGDLPDVFHVNASQLQQLIEADLIMDLTEVFDIYASDTIKNYMNLDADSFESGKRDGKLYGIPQMGFGTITQPNYIWIRKDWREALNLEEPHTMDELVEMMKKFMSNYGGYGIAAEQSLDYLNLLAVAWGAHPDAWIKTEGGQIEFGSIQPEMKEAVRAWADWYREGLLNSDFAIMDIAKMNQDVVAGKTGIQASYQWWGWDPGIDVLKNNGENSYFEPFHIPSATEDDVLHTLYFDTESYTVISKDCRYPEAAIKLINLYSFIVDEDTRGEKDGEWLKAFDDNGMIHVTGAFKVLNPNGDYDAFGRVQEAIKKNDPNILTAMDLTKYNQVKSFMETKDPNQLGGYLQMGPDRSSYKLACEILDNGKYIKSELKGIEPGTLLDAGSTLDDILTEGFTKIIIGDQPIDYFDKVVDNWKKAGGEQATIEMNEIYNK